MKKSCHKIVINFLSCFFLTSQINEAELLRKECATLLENALFLVFCFEIFETCFEGTISQDNSK